MANIITIVQAIAAELPFIEPENIRRIKYLIEISISKQNDSCLYI